MKKWILWMFLTVCVLPVPLAAQKMRDLREYFISPELVMKNRALLGLSADQRRAILDEVKRARSKFTEIEWSLDEEVEKMQAILDQNVVDETTLLAQMDKVLDLERSLKRTQILLTIRIRNQLTPEQLAKVRELRKRGEDEPPPGPGERRPRPPFRRP